MRNKAKTVQQMVGELDEKKVRLQAAPSLPSSCALIPLVTELARRRRVSWMRRRCACKLRHRSLQAVVGEMLTCVCIAGNTSRPVLHRLPCET